MAIRNKWPQVQGAFRDWVQHSGNLRLGETFYSEVDPTLTIFQMICQRGYGPSLKPGLRYGALRSCLQNLAEYALTTKSTIHMPRIGSGEAGGFSLMPLNTSSPSIQNTLQRFPFTVKTGWKSVGKHWNRRKLNFPNFKPIVKGRVRKSRIGICSKNPFLAMTYPVN